MTSTITLSENFEVRVPDDVREALHLKAGDKFAVFVHGGRLELVPVRPIREYRGILRGMDTIIERDQEDRL